MDEQNNIGGANPAADAAANGNGQQRGKNAPRGVARSSSLPSSPDPNSPVDEQMAAVLKSAGLKRMPKTAPEWARFERAQKGE